MRNGRGRVKSILTMEGGEGEQAEGREEEKPVPVDDGGGGE